MSKIARLTDTDRDDIETLVQLGFTSADEIESRATEAIGAYVGGIEMLRANLRDAVALAREWEVPGNPPAHGPRAKPPHGLGPPPTRSTH